ncbi:MAG: DNA repair protein [Spirochaetales bacterium]|uniref:DNA repair protein n=1 Tax=Candidatus Thalassospirochaeta sargassi TaxID=3119039 RepID=A0AAJ1IEX6_9SPIO|nr:DNA repair protein [Spirochaetales bacterium]
MVEQKSRNIVLEQKRIKGLYKVLKRRYGPQGWWPLRSRRITAGACLSYTIGYDSGGYHPGTAEPEDPDDKFEIAVGAVLTQNTTWLNASAAIDSLIDRNLLNSQRLLQAPLEAIAEAIKSSGYYNQKAVKLKALADFFSRLEAPPKREALLEIWGIGPETADCILLYAFGLPVFVVDTYTRRIIKRFTGKGDVEDAGYGHFQQAIQAAFEGDAELNMEFHALLVAHAKQHCLKTPKCDACPAAGGCRERKMFAKAMNFE